MTRLARLVDENDESEDVMVLGGEHGVVTLHMPGGHPECMVLHSPAALPGFDGPHPCDRMEVPCWCMSSISGEELRAVLREVQGRADDRTLWTVMETCYRLYLEGRQR